MKDLFLPGVIILFMCSCIPDNIKEQMNDGMAQAQQMFGDQEFKKAIGLIELHKLRNGSYPTSLIELKFLTPMDSLTLGFVNYTRHDSLYELNLIMEFPSLGGDVVKVSTMQYPPEFWTGLGCLKSNMKKD
jgi:hypothetical protein